MEGKFKAKFIKNGSTPTLSRLPPGFRFQPTDEELLFQYLKRKVYSLPLPASVIPEVNVWADDPWNLPGCDHPDEEMKYFFSSTGPNCGYSFNNGRMGANNTGGYWRDCGAVQRFFPSSEDPMIMGIKKSMVYHKGTGFSSRTADWIMDVYSLVPAPPANYAIPSQDLGDILEKWVICGVVRKKTSSNCNSASSSRLALTSMEEEEEEEETENDDDEASSSSSSSGSTTMADVSSSSSARYMYIR